MAILRRFRWDDTTTLPLHLVVPCPSVHDHPEEGKLAPEFPHERADLPCSAVVPVLVRASRKPQSLCSAAEATPALPGKCSIGSIAGSIGIVGGCDWPCDRGWIRPAARLPSLRTERHPAGRTGPFTNLARWPESGLCGHLRRRLVCSGAEDIPPLKADLDGDPPPGWQVNWIPGPEPPMTVSWCSLPRPVVFPSGRFGRATTSAR